jgi:hypothetical protein
MIFKCILCYLFIEGTETPNLFKVTLSVTLSDVNIKIDS